MPTPNDSHPRPEHAAGFALSKDTARWLRERSTLYEHVFIWRCVLCFLVRFKRRGTTIAMTSICGYARVNLFDSDLMNIIHFFPIVQCGRLLLFCLGRLVLLYGMPFAGVVEGGRGGGEERVACHTCSIRPGAIGGSEQCSRGSDCR